MSTDIPSTDTDVFPTRVDIDPTDPEVQRNMAYLVGRALDQRLHGGPLLDRHPDGYFRVAPDTDDNPGDTDTPYWLQEVRTNREDPTRPATIFTDAYGNVYEVTVRPPNKIHDPNGIIAATLVDGWKKEGANEERRALDWLLGDCLVLADKHGDTELATKIAAHRFIPGAYDPFDVAAPRPEGQ